LTRPEELDRLLLCDAAASALEATHLPLRRHSLRVVVSDFLFPHDGDALASRLARDGSWLALVQLTLPDEADPGVAGAVRLIDAEGRGEFDLVLDARAVADYRARFSRLRTGLSSGARRIGARFTYLAAGRSIRDMGRALTGAGILEAA
jgi:hypothetical protein